MVEQAIVDAVSTSDDQICAGQSGTYSRRRPVVSLPGAFLARGRSESHEIEVADSALLPDTKPGEAATTDELNDAPPLRDRQHGVITQNDRGRPM